MTHNCNYLEIVKISENYDQGQILAANLFSSELLGLHFLVIL